MHVHETNSFELEGRGVAGREAYRSSKLCAFTQTLLAVEETYWSEEIDVHVDSILDMFLLIYMYVFLYAFYLAISLCSLCTTRVTVGPPESF